ncbi:MAG TPA: ASCH domain-containing protein [Chthoniobacter sp.]|jgi:hypothetical protein
MAEKITRALSVRQPHAEMILRGKKKTEYRVIPTRIRERVYIYASTKPGPDEAWRKAHCQPGDLPTGVLVGTVEIVDCIENGRDDYHWTLARPKRLGRRMKPKNQPQPIWFHPF